MTEALLLTVAQLISLTSLSRTTCYELIARHEIQSIKVGRATRIPRASVERWISERIALAESSRAPEPIARLRRTS